MKQRHKTWIAMLSLACALHAQAEDTQPTLSIQKEGDRQVVMIGEEVFAGYNSKDTDKPYLYPIIGPTGANMTRHYPMKEGVRGEATDHPHHTSLWFAHGSVNGIDFWHGGKQNAGTVSTVLTVLPSPAAPSTVIRASSVWLNPDRTVMADVDTDYGFSVLGDGSRVIDFRKAIAPADGIEQLLFGDTKEGTMAIRVHPALRLKGAVATGHCINSEGDKDGACWGKRAKWVAYWGVIDGKTCGVAVFDHPTNLRHPTWWHARDYGLVAANPFGIHDFEKKPKGTGDYTLKQGETLKLRYRFVFFAGTAEEAKVAEKYAQWVKETTPQDKQEAEKQ